MKPLRPNRPRMALARAQLTRNATLPEVGERRLVRAPWSVLARVPWLVVIGLVVACLQGWIAYSQQRIATEQTAISAQDRLDKLLAHAQETQLLAEQLYRMRVGFILGPDSRSCLSEAQCDADVLKALASTRSKSDKADAAALLQSTFEAHQIAAQLFLGTAYSAPSGQPLEQAQWLISKVVMPSIAACNFTNKIGSEFSLALDALAHFSAAAQAKGATRKAAFIAAMDRLRSNFGSGAPTQEPYPMKQYILHMRRMYDVLDRAPFALGKQCEAENAHARKAVTSLPRHTLAMTGAAVTLPPECPADDKCGGWVEMFWHPADGWKQLNDTKH